MELFLSESKSLFRGRRSKKSPGQQLVNKKRGRKQNHDEADRIPIQFTGCDGDPQQKLHTEEIMSLQAMDWALRKVRGLSPTQKLILICLACFGDREGHCFISQTQISEHTNLTRETVNRNLLFLEAKELIATNRQKDDSGREISKRYRINIGSDSSNGGATQTGTVHRGCHE